MSLNLDIVCHDRDVTTATTAEKAARAIGELMPFILAKYGVDAKPAINRSSVFGRTSSPVRRFRNEDLERND